MAVIGTAKKDDLLNHPTEWGLTVSEGAGRSSPGKRMMKFGAYFLFIVASLLAMPVIAGFLFFPSSDGLLLEFAIIAFCLIVATAFKVQSDKTQRNSIQIDYRATELRLGTQKSDGTFIREKVFNFRDIDSVDVQRTKDGTPLLSLLIDGNYVELPFNGTDRTTVEGLAGQISAARESALQAPIRSRIQSKIHGVEASFREVKSRVQSRIAHA